VTLSQLLKRKGIAGILQKLKGEKKISTHQPGFWGPNHQLELPKKNRETPKEALGEVHGGETKSQLFSGAEVWMPRANPQAYLKAREFSSLASGAALH